MFHKLKLQFVLTNLAIITALFVSLTIGAYTLLQIKMISHAEFFSKRLASGINSGMLPEIPAWDEHPPAAGNHGFPGLPRLEHFDFPQPPRPEYFGPPKPPRFLVKPPGPFEPFRLPGPFPLARGDRGFLPPVFFIKLNPAGKVIYQSPGLAMLPNLVRDLAQATEKIVKNPKDTGTIDLLHFKYFYYQTALTTQAGRLIVFQDLRQDKNIQQSLVVALLIIGAIFLVLAMIGSLFMAKRAIAPIQKAWQQQKDFLADASHELRTPLAIIQTNLEVVLSNPEETVTAQMDWLNNIHEELQQMTTLVSSLLFLARVDADQCALEQTNFALDQLVSRMGEAFRPLAKAKHIRLEKEIAGPVTCYGDESHLRRVIENLLDNAIRHTPAGGKITLRLQQSAKKILLTVTDTGEGIPPEHLAKIFDRFYQVDASRSKGKSGLGLSIVKHIVEKHGGTIQVASAPGSGTTFAIQLPALKDNSMAS